MLLLLFGILPMILGRVVMFPIPGAPMAPGYGDQSFLSPNDTSGTNGSEGLGGVNSGCPYDWCLEIPAIHIAQFMVGFVIGTVGYPFCVTLTGSIYSKLMGGSRSQVTGRTGTTLTMSRASGSGCLLQPAPWLVWWDHLWSLRSTRCWAPMCSSLWSQRLWSSPWCSPSWRGSSSTPRWSSTSTNSNRVEPRNKLKEQQVEGKEQQKGGSCRCTTRRRRTEGATLGLG